MPFRFRPLLAATLLTASINSWASPTFNPAGPVEQPSGGTPNLWVAAARGEVAVIEQLLAAGSFIDEADPKGMTPLIHALRQRQLAAARTLLDRGANPSKVTRGGFTPLAYAFWAGLATEGNASYNGDWLRLLLDRGADVHTTTALQKPLLALVAQVYPPVPDALQIVLPYGPRINQRFGTQCETALMGLVRNDIQHAEASQEVVRLLLEAGALPNLTSITNHNVGTDRSHPTPLLRATQALARDELWNHGPREQHLVAFLDLLFKHGADPRVGGIGGQHEDHQSAGCSELPQGAPGSSGSASPAWSDFSGSTGNPGLTEALGNTAPFRSAFDRILSASAPIARGEVGYPALDAALSSYTRVIDMLEMIDSGRYPHPADKRRHENLLVRKADLENAMRTLLDLGVATNPSYVMLPPGRDWNELWIARRVPEEGGIERLPLYEHRMPDALYQAFLQGGANAAIRPGGHFSKSDSLLTHLIRNNAASKLALLREHLGLLTKVPTWCHRSIADVATALVNQQKAAQSKAMSPSDQAAKNILLDLMAHSNCLPQAPNHPAMQALRELLKRLDDAEISSVFSKHAPRPTARPAPTRRPGRGG